MFRIKLALMRVAGAAVFAKRLAPQTHAIQSLVQDDSITGTQVFYILTDFFDTATDFMTKDLRIDLKRNLLTIFVDVVVRMTLKNVRVGAALTDR
ncbi:MAG TPA: hypothetical protein VHQ95_11810 [Pyrinomonadaceae bacterium]|nr:hypothetical protein [Pyrinomonadaceae bacterium]